MVLFPRSTLSIALAEGAPGSVCNADTPDSDCFVSICNSSMLILYTHTVVGFCIIELGSSAHIILLQTTCMHFKVHTVHLVVVNLKFEKPIVVAYIK